VATSTGPDDWANQSDEVLATALDVLDRNAKEVKRRGRNR
jgi:hypothetical protein